MPDVLGDTSNQIRQLLQEAGDENEKQRTLNAKVDKAIALIHARWVQIDKAKVIDKVTGYGWQIKGIWWVLGGLLVAVFELYRRK